MEKAETDDDLRNTFEMDEATELLLASGFRKPISSLIVQDKEKLRSSLIDYHCMLKVKAALDQFCEGLKCVGVMEIMVKHPNMFKTMFVADSTPLTAG